MKRILTLTITTLATVLLFWQLIRFSSWFETAGFENTCTERVLSEAKSSDGKYVATLYEWNGGALSDWMTHVNIRRSDQNPKFNVTGTLDDQSVFMAASRPRVEIRWDTDRCLEIRSKASQVSEKDTRWSDVQIRYLTVR